MASDKIELSDSGVTVPSDSENYSANNEMVSSVHSTSSTPLVLYKPPTVWSVLRGAAINLLLPFVNGLMLGFGELFAHEAAYRLGWANTKISSFRTQRVAAGGYGRLHNSQTLAGGLTSRTAAASVVPVSGVVSVRYNSSWFSTSWFRRGSSTPTTETEAKPEPVVEPAVAAPPPPVEVQSQSGELQPPSGELADLGVSDIESIPEHIGYLKDLGLDFGWGPSSMIEYVIEHFHMWTGLPWWASIVGTGLLVRMALLYPMLGAADMSTKTQNIKHLVNPLRMRMLQENSAGNMVGATRTKAEIQKLQQEHGIQPSKVFIPMIQIPLGFGCYRVVSSMASLPVPGLATESVGWITDLTVADPFFLLPLTTSMMMYLTFRKGGEAGMNEMQKTSFGKAMLYGLPAMSFCFVAFFPSALQLYFASTGLFALAQSNLLRNDSFRKWANIALPDRSLPSENPFAGLDRSTQSRGLRMLQEAVQAETAKLHEQSKQRNSSSSSLAQAQSGSDAVQQQISFIDRMINSFKENKDNFQREASDKMKELKGDAPETNADGSAAEKPRLSEKDLKLAADYERRRKEEDEWKREERNHARREAHMKVLEAQRRKARASWDKNVASQQSSQSSSSSQSPDQ